MQTEPNAPTAPAVVELTVHAVPDALYATLYDSGVAVLETLSPREAARVLAQLGLPATVPPPGDPAVAIALMLRERSAAMFAAALRTSGHAMMRAFAAANAALDLYAAAIDLLTIDQWEAFRRATDPAAAAPADERDVARHDD